MKKKSAKNDLIFDSLKAAAAGLKLPLRVIQLAKQRGCPAFRSNRVYGAELLRWIEANGLTDTEATTDPKSEKLMEEIRKLRLANDSKEGRLVERAWVAGKIQGMAGDLNRFRAKSEAEHPKNFAEAAGDMAKCRTVIRGIWDEIFVQLRALSKHLEEAKS